MGFEAWSGSEKVELGLRVRVGVGMRVGMLMSVGVGEGSDRKV